MKARPRAAGPKSNWDGRGTANRKRGAAKPSEAIGGLSIDEDSEEAAAEEAEAEAEAAEAEAAAEEAEPVRGGGKKKKRKSTSSDAEMEAFLGALRSTPIPKDEPEVAGPEVEPPVRTTVRMREARAAKQAARAKAAREAAAPDVERLTVRMAEAKAAEPTPIPSPYPVAPTL